jgi:hypothetical protein
MTLNGSQCARLFLLVEWCLGSDKPVSAMRSIALMASLIDAESHSCLVRPRAIGG